MNSFTAALEGQLTISEGDALTLIDDSNAFWALVRHRGTVDGGYVPAELLETPLERTARLNSAKNADITLLSMDISNESSQVLGRGASSTLTRQQGQQMSLKRSVQFSGMRDDIVDETRVEQASVEEDEEDVLSSPNVVDADDTGSPSSSFLQVTTCGIITTLI
jgi:hypothetical protein